MTGKNIGIIVTVLALLVAAVGVTWQIATTNSTPTVSQQTSGAGSPTVNVHGSSNTQLNVTVEEQKKGLEIPSFKGEIQPYSKKLHEQEKENYKASENFNAFILNNDGKIVFLDIYPYYTDEDLDHGFDMFKFPDVFTITDVPYSHEMGGVEYLIDKSTGKDFYYDIRQEARRIKGYFKVVGIQGPQMGFMSASLRPVNIEDAALLKK